MECILQADDRICRAILVSSLSLYSDSSLHKKCSFTSRIYSGNVSRSVRIWSHLLKKSLMESFIFCALVVQKMFCLPSVTKAYRYGKLQGKSWSTLFFFKKANKFLLLSLCFLVESSRTFNSARNGKVVYLLFKYCFLVMTKSGMVFYENFSCKRKSEKKNAACK